MIISEPVNETLLIEYHFHSPNIVLDITELSFRVKWDNLVNVLKPKSFLGARKAHSIELKGTMKIYMRVKTKLSEIFLENQSEISFDGNMKPMEINNIIICCSTHSKERLLGILW